MEATSLSLVVIRSSNLEAALSFYGALGLSFVQEQHGSGPAHYACDLGGLVMEIYPGQEGAAPGPRAAGSTILGLRVASVGRVLAALQALGVEPEAAPRDSAWGRWANVADPDGRMVQLSQAVGASD